VKRFLETHGIAYDPGTSDVILKGKAKARMKRIAEEGISPDAKKQLFQAGVNDGLSIKDLNEIIERIKTEKKDVDKHYKASFIITDVDSTSKLTVKKHGVGQGVPCTGKIQNGKCWGCGEYTHGVDAYSFRASLQDVEDETQTLNVMCTEGAGSTLCGADATTYSELALESQKDVIEKFMFVPIKSGVWIKYKGEANDLLVLIYGCNKLDA